MTLPRSNERGGGKEKKEEDRVSGCKLAAVKEGVFGLSRGGGDGEISGNTRYPVR